MERGEVSNRINVEMTEDAELASDVETVITTPEMRKDALGRREKRLPRRLEDFIVG